MNTFDKFSEGILKSTGRGIGKIAKGTWQNVIAPAAVAAGQEIAGTLGKEISKAASSAIQKKFNPTQVTPQNIPGAAAGIGSGTSTGTSSGSLKAPISTGTAPAAPVVTPGGGSIPPPAAPGASGKGSSTPGAMKASTPKKPGAGIMIDPSTGATTTTAGGGTATMGAPGATATTGAPSTTVSTSFTPPDENAIIGDLARNKAQLLSNDGLMGKAKYVAGMKGLGGQPKSGVELMKRGPTNDKGVENAKYALAKQYNISPDKLVELLGKVFTESKDKKLIYNNLTQYVTNLIKENFNNFENVNVLLTLLKEEKYDDCLYVLDEWFLPLLAAAGRSAAVAGASGAASNVGYRAANRAMDKYEARKAQQQAQNNDVGENEEGEDCECEAGANTQISLKGKVEQLKKAIHILKSIGLLENKYIMKDMANSTNTVQEGAIGRALGGAAIGSLIPGVGPMIGAGLGVGGGQVAGSIRKGLLGPKPGEDAEAKKKKKIKFNAKKADRNKNGKLEGWEKGLANKFTSKESTNINNFIKYISQKNYAEANKYLQEVVNSKLQARIIQALKQKLF